MTALGGSWGFEKFGDVKQGNTHADHKACRTDCTGKSACFEKSADFSGDLAQSEISGYTHVSVLQTCSFDELHGFHKH